MKKTEFIEQAMGMGANVKDALFLEHIYNPEEELTDEEKSKALDYLENNENGELIELGKQYKSANEKVTANMMAERAMMELNQMVSSCELSFDEITQFNLKLIARLTKRIQGDLRGNIPDF
ncbi:hypothetical protein AB1K32_25435 [Metabacillus dongyingensis]|uniref:hypothetical protein n=1 Tax=Metabacillus dongyingensis TaxID=2874282 RepID=UPI003B8D4BE1